MPTGAGDTRCDAEPRLAAWPLEQKLV